MEGWYFVHNILLIKDDNIKVNIYLDWLWNQLMFMKSSVPDSAVGDEIIKHGVEYFGNPFRYFESLCLLGKTDTVSDLNA